MKGRLAALGVLTLAAVAAALAYQAVARQRDYRLLIARGDSALREDQTFAAIEAYSGALALRPGSMLPHLRLGETYQRRGNLDEAAREFRLASSLDPTTARPLEELGDVTYQRQRYARAIEAYGRALRLDDRSARVFYKLALAQYRDADPASALQSVRQSLTLDPRSADASYLLGLCLRDSRQITGAIRAFQQAVSIAPALVAAREELADLFHGLNRFDEEIEQLQALAAIDGNVAERQIALGLAQHRAGQSDLAVQTLGSALDRWPDTPGVYRALGRVWLDRAQEDPAFLSKAREALSAVAKNPAASSDTLTMYAQTLVEEGDVEGAARTLDQAMERFPIALDAFALYVAVAERLNRSDAAERAQTRYELLKSEF